METSTMNSSGNFTPSGDNSSFLLNEWQIALAYVMFAILIIVSLIGNSCMIWLIVSNKNLRTQTNYFILNLATSDVLVTVFNTASLAVYNIHYSWILGGSITCKLIQFSGPVCLAASIGTHLAICYERHRVILTPLRPRLTKHNIRLIILGIWLFAILFSTPYIFVYKVVPDDDSGSICIPGANTLCGETCVKIYQTIYQWGRFVLLYTLPLVIMTIMYWKISSNLWSNKEETMLYNSELQQQSTSQRKEKLFTPKRGKSSECSRMMPKTGSGCTTSKTSRTHLAPPETKTSAQDSKIVRKIQAKRKLVLMLITLVVIFALTWISFHVVFLISFFDPTFFGTYALKIYLISFWLAMSNTMYNPLVYCSLNATFREGFKYIFRFLPCVKYDKEKISNASRSTMTPQPYRHPARPCTSVSSYRATSMPHIVKDLSRSPSVVSYIAVPDPMEPNLGMHSAQKLMEQTRRENALLSNQS